MDNQTATAVDTSELEKSFNETLEEFRKSFAPEDEGTEESKGDVDLEKAEGKSSKKKAKMDYDDDADDDEESEDDEDEEDEDKKSVKKSVEDILAEDPEAEAAMDVEPFLRQLAKAIDQRIEGLAKSISDNFTGVDTMLKSQGKAMYIQMELQKAQGNTVQSIAKEDREIAGLRRLGKSRFETPDGEPLEVQGPTVLAKSLEWMKGGKINALESGMIESRVNKGVLGRANDALDQKVAALMKEAS